MVAGRSIVMELQFDVDRIAINDPSVADILVVQQGGDEGVTRR